MALGSSRAFSRLVLKSRPLSLGLRTDKVGTEKKEGHRLEGLLAQEKFARRHIGPSSQETAAMLRACGVEVSLCICLIDRNVFYVILNGKWWYHLKISLFYVVKEAIKFSEYF